MEIGAGIPPGKEERTEGTSFTADPLVAPVLREQPHQPSIDPSERVQAGKSNPDKDPRTENKP